MGVMAEWIYCATNFHVDAEKTASLLRSHRAIFCQGRHTDPAPVAGERVWLVWRWNHDAKQTILLGLGKLVNHGDDETAVYWRDSDEPGLLAASHSVGYLRKGADTEFLVLQETRRVLDAFPIAREIGSLEGGLNLATADALHGLLGALHGA